MTTTTRAVIIGSVLLGVGAFTLQSCGEPVPASASAPDASAPVDFNIVALLDLSDRVSPEKHPNQADRDKRILKELVDLFEDKVRGHLFVASRDRLRVAIAQQAGSGYDPSEFADKLSIDMQQIFEGGKPAFDRAKGEMLATVDQLYDAATKTAHYTGANIPLFFRDHLSGYVDRPEPGRTVRNVLVIVTDGYIELDSRIKATLQDRGHRTPDMRLTQFRGMNNWQRAFDEGDYGLIVDRQDQCSGLEVLVLEVTLDPQHQDDKNLIFKYWNKWLTEMGCGKAELNLTEDSLSQTTARIDTFLAGS